MSAPHPMDRPESPHAYIPTRDPRPDLEDQDVALGERPELEPWDAAGLTRLLEAVRRHADDTAALGPFLRARLEPHDNGMAGHTKRHLDALRELVDTLVPIATGDAGDLEGDAGVAWQALTILASTWRHHPDYREGWAP